MKQDNATPESASSTTAAEPEVNATAEATTATSDEATKDNEATKTNEATKDGDDKPAPTDSEAPKADGEAAKTSASQPQEAHPTEVEQLRAQVADLNDKYMRKCAEFDNFRKRTARDKAELIKSAGSTLLEGLLPVVDDFERALQHLASQEAADPKAVVDGVELIHKKFTDYMAKNGLVEIATKGEPFDTNVHEAVAQMPAPTPDQKGKIFDCVEKGYKLGEKVIRFAKVVVCQ